MTSSCTIGIDMGLTSVKAAAFDDAGHELEVVRASTPREHLSAAEHEIDMEQLWQSACRLLDELGGRLRRRGIEPRGLGVTGAGNGLYATDGELQPVRAAIPSTDSRAQAIADGLTSDDAVRLQTLTGSRPWASQPATLLRWLHDHEPESYARTRWVLSCKDWITARLTGRPGADYSDASAGGLVSLDDLRYTAEAFTRLGLPPSDVDRLPPLRGSGEVVGTLTAATAQACGLPDGLPVIAGAMDCVAGTYGAGGHDRGDVTIIVGTWAINAVVAPTTSPPPPVGMISLMPDPRSMLAMEVAPTSAANLEWFARAVTPVGAEVVAASALVEEAAAAPPGADGLLFLPFVYGSEHHPAGSGSFIGAAGIHDRSHLARAVIEGVAHYHRVQLGRILASGASIGDGPWRLAGGGARSRLWAQIFADVLDHPLTPQTSVELGARGVAALAATAVEVDVTGWWSGDDAAVVSPGGDVELLRSRGLAFDRYLAALGPVWADQG